MIETDVNDIRIAVAQAKNHNKFRFQFLHGGYADNYNNEKRKLEEAISDLGYNFKWSEVYDNHGIAWATLLEFELR